MTYILLDIILLAAGCTAAQALARNQARHQGTNRVVIILYFVLYMQAANCPAGQALARGLAFTRYCHQYGIQKGGRWEGIYCAMVVQ